MTFESNTDCIVGSSETVSIDLDHLVSVCDAIIKVWYADLCILGISARN